MSLLKINEEALMKKVRKVIKEEMKKIGEHVEGTAVQINRLDERVKVLEEQADAMSFDEKMIDKYLEEGLGR